MNYLIVCNTQGKHYLLMTKEKELESYAVRAYSSKEDVMKAFDGYVRAWKGDVTWSTSACMGMVQMQPVAIKAPENSEDLRKYVIGTTIMHISGGAIGRGYHGLHVDESILEHKQFDLFKETMQAAGVL